jgi:tetratricopeptide (TPR) repeat protein
MMTYSKQAMALALAFGGVAVPASALAQMGGSMQSTPSASQPAAPKAGERKYNISSGARNAIATLQKAVAAKDAAAIPAALAAAKAAAKTNDDKYVIGQLQLRAAVDQKDSAGITAGIEAILASGAATPEQRLPLEVNLGKQHYGAKQYDQAATAFEAVLRTDPNNADALAMLAETRKAQGRVPDAVSLLQRGISAKQTSGQKAPEEWYKRAVALAYEAKLPAVFQLSRDWVAAYPSPTTWRDTLRIYQNSNTLSDDVLIDLLRLQRASGALAGESDYYRYANTAFTRGYPGEAKAVLEEGFASKAIDRNKPIFREVLAAASSKTAADRASLAGLETAALASPAAKQAMVTGDAYLGYGEYAKAAALYRAALTKSGVDPNLANLRLGIALARSGDKAGANAAFSAVSGPRADIAKYWQLYLATRA